MCVHVRACDGLSVPGRRALQHTPSNWSYVFKWVLLSCVCVQARLHMGARALLHVRTPL